MYIRLAREIARPQMFAIMDILKRSTGLPVGHLAQELGMSYMGVKQHCVEMEAKGLLETWRAPKAVGRPEKLYRLTEKAASFYPEVGSELTVDILDSVKELYGGAAPERLLMSYFAKRATYYQGRLKGASVGERLRHLAKLRDAEGHCAEVSVDARGQVSLVEYHSPMRQIAEAYPEVLRLEELMFERLLGAPVSRSAEKVAGVTRHAFLVPTLTLALSA
jgi:predicted ArsR family transcriptional regulator